MGDNPKDGPEAVLPLVRGVSLLEPAKTGHTADTGLHVAVAVFVAWGVSAVFPEVNMPEPVAAAIAYVVGPVIEDVRSVRHALSARLARWISGD